MYRSLKIDFSVAMICSAWSFAIRSTMPVMFATCDAMRSRVTRYGMTTVQQPALFFQRRSSIACFIDWATASWVPRQPPVYRQFDGPSTPITMSSASIHSTMSHISMPVDCSGFGIGPPTSERASG